MRGIHREPSVLSTESHLLISSSRAQRSFRETAACTVSRALRRNFSTLQPVFAHAGADVFSRLQNGSDVRGVALDRKSNTIATLNCRTRWVLKIPTITCSERGGTGNADTRTGLLYRRRLCRLAGRAFKITSIRIASLCRIRPKAL